MGVRMGDDPPGLGLLVTWDHALASGLTIGQINHRVRSGRWTSLRRGVYLREEARASAVDRFARAREDHVLASIAASLRWQASIVGLTSAATVLDLPLTSGVPQEVQLLVPRHGWAGTRAGVRALRSDVPTDHMTWLPQWSAGVTSVARTWVDIARTESLADALSVGDHCLREGLVSVDELREAVDRLGETRGVRRALEALVHLDGRRETPLESLSWARFLEWGIPLPEIQREFYDASGFIGRVDFFWPELGIVGEADGRLKYDREMALWKEKRREDRLRSHGLGMVRWGWGDMASPSSPFRFVLAAALARAA